MSFSGGQQVNGLWADLQLNVGKSKRCRVGRGCCVFARAEKIVEGVADHIGSGFDSLIWGGMGNIHDMS